MVDVQPRFSTVVLAKGKTNKTKLESQHNTFTSGCKINSTTLRNLKPKRKQRNQENKL